MMTSMMDSIDKDSLLLFLLTVLGLMALNAIRKLFVAPSIESIQSISTKTLPHLGNDDTITVWGFGMEEEHGVSDPSPFVSRVEAYLRLIQQPYTKLESKGGVENPRGKVPFANVKGTMVDDSSRIIDTIKNMFGNEPDAKLTEEQKTMGYLILQLLQGSLYWVLLHQMFNTEVGRRLFRAEMSTKFPPVVRSLVSCYVFRAMNKNLFGCGVGRMSHADIVKKGQGDVRALSQILGTKKYILGTESPCSYDCDVYSFLALLFYNEAQISEPWVVDIKKELPNLVEYVKRMQAILYPGE